MIILEYWDGKMAQLQMRRAHLAPATLTQWDIEFQHDQLSARLKELTANAGLHGYTFDSSQEAALGVTRLAKDATYRNAQDASSSSSACLAPLQDASTPLLRWAQDRIQTRRQTGSRSTRSTAQAARKSQNPLEQSEAKTNCLWRRPWILAQGWLSAFCWCLRFLCRSA